MKTRVLKTICEGFVKLKCPKCGKIGIFYNEFEHKFFCDICKRKMSNKVGNKIIDENNYIWHAMTDF